MLKSDRTNSLPVDVASELRDALSRRQKELPARWLAASDALAKRDGGARGPAHALEDTERELAIRVVRGRLGAAVTRGVVCMQPSASGATRDVVAALSKDSPITSLVAMELDQSLAMEMAERVCPGNVTSTAISSDPTIDLRLPRAFPRPRVYLCLGNTLGQSTAVGTVRMLRVMRTTIVHGDSIVFGLAAHRVQDAPDSASIENAATRHLAALGLIQSTTGAPVDLSWFDFKPAWDRESGRLETHLVARRALSLEVPGVCDVRFRKGESIRTSVSCVLDRTRVAAMLTGVGLALADWTTDAAGSYVVALAVPAS